MLNPSRRNLSKPAAHDMLVPIGPACSWFRTAHQKSIQLFGPNKHDPSDVFWDRDQVRPQQPEWRTPVLMTSKLIREAHDQHAQQLVGCFEAFKFGQFTAPQ